MIQKRKRWPHFKIVILGEKRQRSPHHPQPDCRNGEPPQRSLPEQQSEISA